MYYICIFMILYDLHREAKGSVKRDAGLASIIFQAHIACWWGWTAWKEGSYMTFASRSKPDDRPGILCASDLDMSSIWIDMESGVMQRFSDMLTICLHNFQFIFWSYSKRKTNLSGIFRVFLLNESKGVKAGCKVLQLSFECFVLIAHLK